MAKRRLLASVLAITLIYAALFGYLCHAIRHQLKSDWKGPEACSGTNNAVLQDGIDCICPILAELPPVDLLA